MAATRPPQRFLTAWFCPFAHRAQIALEHTGVRYEWVEALGWNAGPAGTWEHTKTQELVGSSPNGTVPVLVDQPTGEVVYESAVCIEYIDDLAQTPASLYGPESYAAAASRSFTPPSLLGATPQRRADARLQSSWVNKELCSPYYAILVKQDDDERRVEFEKLLSSVAEFSNKLDANWGAASAGGAEFGAEVGAGGVYRGGSYFYGDQLSMVDCMLLPHAFRYFAIEHYRGESFAIPRTAEFEPFHRWRDAMVETASVARTLPDKGRYIEHVRKYAEGTARSMVANAVRAGKAAHEMGEK
mmetsp:Transcript_72593/g.206742  ORF Transcript_72593/g.206742 Transcript_72593/m.206742 type:complete len:300 (-) Transcript_72593:798-1697(-)